MFHAVRESVKYVFGKKGLIKTFLSLFSATLLMAGVLSAGGCTPAAQDNPDRYNYDLGLPGEALFGETGNKGALTLLLTDFPIQNKNVTAVMVNFRSIEVNSADAGWITLADFGDAGKTFDLLKLQNGVTSPLGSFSLEPGVYEQMRFVLNDSNSVEVIAKGETTIEPLKTPSGQKTGIKLIHSFTVDSKGYTVLTVDFDAQKSIHYNKAQGFILKPVISVVGSQTTPGAGSMISAAQGGSAGMIGEIAVDIPAGALSADTQIEILPLKGTPYNPPLSSRALLSSRYELLPDGTQFNGDITVTMNYDPAEIAARGLDENDIDIVYYDETAQDWVSIGGVVNTATKTVTAQVNHFTAFGMTSAQGNAPMITPAEIRYTGYDPVTTLATTQVPEKVVATVAPKAGTVTSVNLYLFKAGQASNPSVISMTENPAGSGQYEVLLDPALFYPELAFSDVQVYIEAVDSSGSVSTAPKGALLADPLTWHLYQYNPDADADGMNDRWEFDNGLNVAVNDAAGDLDSDGITNLDEYTGGTNPAGFDATIGGTVSGLVSGELLVLDNNGENFSVIGDGSGSDTFLFVNRVLDTAAYHVTALISPTGKDCTVTGGSGNVAGGHVHVTVDCVTNKPVVLPGIFADTDVNSGTSAITFGDIDGDGDQDLIEGNRNKNRVYFNDGAGNFSDSGQTLGMSITMSVAAGDIDGDLDIDIVVGNDFEPNKVYFNDGNGVFTDSGQSLGSFNRTYAVVLGDVDGDGDLDLAVGNAHSESVVHFNDGNGNFGPQVESLGVDATTALAMGDVDGDGDSDIVTGNHKKGTKIFLNDGSGRFTDTGQSWGLTDTTAIVLGDVNGDGAADIVETNYNAPGKIYFNDGAGNFTDSGQSLSTVRANDVVLGDVNSDGVIDIVVANNGQSNYIYVNDGSGNFTAPTKLFGATYTKALALGDIDGDSDLDIVEGIISHVNPVYFNNGLGDYTLGQVVDKKYTRAVVLGDVDNDGDLDYVEGNDGQPGQVFLNDGTGSFANSGQQLGRSKTYAVLLDDIDGDGDPDFITGDRYDRNKVYLNDGAGNFTLAYYFGGAYNTSSLALGDIDGDGDPDVIEGDMSYYVRIYKNNGGTLGGPYQSLRGGSTFAVASGDIDGDGDLDFVAGNSTSYYGQPDRVYLNDGAGNFIDSGQMLGADKTGSVALGDVDGDGDLDLVTGSVYTGSKIYFNDGNGVFTDSGQYLESPYWTKSVQLGDVDHDGDLDIVEGNIGSNKIHFNDGSGVFTDSGQFLGGSITYSIGLGDVDGDGDLDILGGNQGQVNNIYPNLTY